MKALVTGGAGFIGSNLVKLLLEHGWSVSVLDNLSTGYRQNLEGFPEVSLVEADIRDRQATLASVKGADVVFHLAACIGNVKSIEDPIFDSGVNVLGTLNVLEAARLNGVPKLVVSSSAAIFGELKHLPINESHPVEPDSPYGVSKLAAEKHALCYAKLYDLSVICLRYFNVYGVNQRYDLYGNVIPIFGHRLMRNEKLSIYGDGEQTRDFVNVSDVARANLLAAQAEGVSGAFNIGSGTSITINELARMMQEAGGIRAEVEHVPPRKGEVRDSLADISAARSALGFEPKVTMDVGLREYMKWLLDDAAVAQPANNAR
jgi:UDP-glucose 4-epimerase